MSTLKRKKISASPSYHHGDLGNALKKNALKIIKQKGIAGLNLRDLAGKCSVSAAAVYRHYQSKDHLLAALAEEGFEELQRVMSVANNPNKIQNMGIAYIHFAQQHSVYFQLMFNSFIDKSKFPSLLKANQNAIQVLRNEVENRIKQGLMQGKAESLTYTAWALVHGIAMLLLDKQLHSEKMDINQLALEMTVIAGRGLLNV